MSCCGILHNCAKAVENKLIYRKNKFMQVSQPYCNARTTIKEICMPVIFTRSYVFEDDEIKDLQIPEATAQDTANALGKAVMNEERHQHDGWHAYEIAVGISNLSANLTNVKYFVQKGILRHLLHMLDFKDPYEQECALNAIWSLTHDFNREEVLSTEDLSDKLKKCLSSASEGVKQAAIRLQMKLTKVSVNRMLRTEIVESKCEYKQLCKRFKDSLQLSGHYFDTDYDMCFCAICHGGREDKTKYTRGNPPKEYGIPVGWYRFGLSLPPKAKALKALEDWHRAFHGTNQQYVNGILEVGEIVPAGRLVIGGKKIKEQPGHYNEDVKPDGFNTKQVFLSPSIRYAGVDAYATPSSHTDKEKKKKYTSKTAFQVLIKPDSYEVGPETIGAMSEVDPGFSNQDLEWSTDQQGSVVLYGLLVKLD